MYTPFLADVVGGENGEVCVSDNLNVLKKRKYTGFLMTMDPFLTKLTDEKRRKLHQTVKRSVRSRFRCLQNGFEALDETNRSVSKSPTDEKYRY